MADYPPYMNAYGNVTKILNKMKDAQTPERFSQDFLETVLGFSGGGARPIIGLLKRLGFVGTDGSPTELYKRFRNPAQSQQAMNEAMRRGYAELYKRNQYAHALDRKGLEGLIVEATGLDASSGTLKAIANTFEAFKGFANFELATSPEVPAAAADDAEHIDPGTGHHQVAQVAPLAGGGVGFSYTIYLNLPETDDVAVFNAIFKSLKENLLS